MHFAIHSEFAPFHLGLWNPLIFGIGPRELRTGSRASTFTVAVLDFANWACVWRPRTSFDLVEAREMENMPAKCDDPCFFAALNSQAAVRTSDSKLLIRPAHELMPCSRPGIIPVVLRTRLLRHIYLMKIAVQSKKLIRNLRKFQIQCSVMSSW